MLELIEFLDEFDPETDFVVTPDGVFSFDF